MVGLGGSEKLCVESVLQARACCHLWHECQKALQAPPKVALVAIQLPHHGGDEAANQPHAGLCFRPAQCGLQGGSWHTCYSVHAVFGKYDAQILLH